MRDTLLDAIHLVSGIALLAAYLLVLAYYAVTGKVFEEDPFGYDQRN